MANRGDEESRIFSQVNAGSWEEYKRLVVSELERLDSSIRSLSHQISQDGAARSKEANIMAVEIAMLKVKASMLGSVFGAVVGAVVAAIVSVVAHALMK